MNFDIFLASMAAIGLAAVMIFLLTRRTQDYPQRRGSQVESRANNDRNNNRR